MADYSFLTTWHIPADISRVWDALIATDRYAEWWPGVESHRPLTEATLAVGARAERVVKGALPYRLTYVTTLTRIDPPREIAYDSEGDLVGSGRFVLTEEPGGTNVTFHWNVATTGRLMNRLAPLLRPLFAWNHDVVMTRGEKGLRQHLGLK